VKTEKRSEKLLLLAGERVKSACCLKKEYCVDEGVKQKRCGKLRNGRGCTQNMGINWGCGVRRKAKYNLLLT